MYSHSFPTTVPLDMATILNLVFLALAIGMGVAYLRHFDRSSRWPVLFGVLVMAYVWLVYALSLFDVFSSIEDRARWLRPSHAIMAATWISIFLTKRR